MTVVNLAFCIFLHLLFSLRVRVLSILLDLYSLVRLTPEAKASRGRARSCATIDIHDTRQFDILNLPTFLYLRYICFSSHLKHSLFILDSHRSRSDARGASATTPSIPRKVFSRRQRGRKGRGQVERRIRTAARIQWKVMNIRSSCRSRVSYLSHHRRRLDVIPLSAARISSRHSLGRDESENSSLCSQEMTYCLPRIWVLHRARAPARRRRITRPGLAFSPPRTWRPPNCLLSARFPILHRCNSSMQLHHRLESIGNRQSRLSLTTITNASREAPIFARLCLITQRK